MQLCKKAATGFAQVMDLFVCSCSLMYVSICMGTSLSRFLFFNSLLVCEYDSACF